MLRVSYQNSSSRGFSLMVFLNSILHQCRAGIASSEGAFFMVFIQSSEISRNHACLSTFNRQTMGLAFMEVSIYSYIKCDESSFVFGFFYSADEGFLCGVSIMQTMHRVFKRTLSSSSGYAVLIRLRKNRRSVHSRKILWCSRILLLTS